MKKFKPMKVKNSSIKLPDEFLDHFLINEGDYLALIEENGKFYLRKTREEPADDVNEGPVNQSTEQQVPPRTFDEIMREAQKQFAGGETIPENLMKSVQDALKDPEMMKKIQDMAMGLFKDFSFPSSPSNVDSEPSSSDTQGFSNKKSKKKTDEEDEDEDDGNDDDDDDKDSSFKIDIE